MEQCPFFFSPNSRITPAWSEIENDLRSNKNEKKIIALQQLIQFQVTGFYPPTNILTAVVNFISGTQDHTLQKLLFLYFEHLGSNPSETNNEDIKNQILMTTNNLLKLIDHSNEYIRGAALRFASRFQDPQVIGPLLPKIQSSLTHQAAYVRRHAIVAFGRIYQRWPHICPDAPQDIFSLLETEQNPTCRRVAFLLLCEISPSYASRYLSTISKAGLLTFPEPMQLTAASLMKTLCNDDNKTIYLPALFDLLSSPYPCVQLEAAHTMLKLTSSFAAAEAGLSTLLHLMQSVPISALQQSIISQIEDLLLTHASSAQKLATDFLPVLQSKPVREPLLSLISKLATADNVISISKFLLNELQSTLPLLSAAAERSDATFYAKLLISTLRNLSSAFPCAKDDSRSLTHALYDSIRPFWSKTAELASLSLQVARDLSVLEPMFSASIAQDLCLSLSSITAPLCLRDAVFLISIFSDDGDSAINSIVEAFAPAPVASPTATNVVRDDGTYAQVESTVTQKSKEGPDRLDNDRFMIVAVITSVARLCVRFSAQIQPETSTLVNQFIDNMTASLQLDQSQLIHTALARYAIDHPTEPAVISALVTRPVQQYSVAQEALSAPKEVKQSSKSKGLPDSPISFGSLLQGNYIVKNVAKTAESERVLQGRLFQMTGPADDVFCECRTITKEFEIELEMRVLNQKNNRKNITLELNCVGALKLAERPAPFSLGPLEASVMRARVRVTSAAGGKIYGTLSYTTDGGEEDLKLAPLKVETAEFMREGTIGTVEFRKKWEAFIWEKRTQVSCKVMEEEPMQSFLRKIVQAGKMVVIAKSMDKLPFLTANLYSKSVFGEEVLANVNVHVVDGELVGFVTLRTTEQAVAISFAKIFSTIQSGN